MIMLLVFLLTMTSVNTFATLLEAFINNFLETHTHTHTHRHKSIALPLLCMCARGKNPENLSMSV